MANEQGVLECLHVARQIIGEWARDNDGRVNVHPDAISKAVNAVIFQLEGLRGEPKQSAIAIQRIRTDVLDAEGLMPEDEPPINRKVICPECGTEIICGTNEPTCIVCHHSWRINKEPKVQ